MAKSLITKIFGTKSGRTIKSYLPIVNEINRIAEQLVDKTDAELIERAQAIKSQVIAARTAAEEAASGKDREEATKLIQKAEQAKLD